MRNFIDLLSRKFIAKQMMSAKQYKEHRQSAKES